MKGRVILIPWHIGDWRDITLRTLSECKRLRVLLSEEPKETARQLSEVYRIDTSRKVWRRITQRESPKLLAEVRGWLERGDVGLLSSGGAPCLLDPGAWLVRELRRAGERVEAAAGASVVSAIFSLSGIEWLGRINIATVAFYVKDGPWHCERKRFSEILTRERDAVVVLLSSQDAASCLKTVAARCPGRWVSVFCDLTKLPPEKFPMSGRVETRLGREWADAGALQALGSVSDLSLMVYPRGWRP